GPAKAATMMMMTMAADPPRRHRRPAMVVAAMPVAATRVKDRRHAPVVPEINRNQDEKRNNEEFSFRSRADAFSRTAVRANALQAGPHRSAKTDAYAARAQGRRGQDASLRQEA